MKNPPLFAEVRLLPGDAVAMAGRVQRMIDISNLNKRYDHVIEMKTIKLNAIIDIASLIMLVPVMISGAVTLWILPSGGLGFRGGSGDIASLLFLGMTRQEWRDIHDITGMLFFILVAIHLFQHFRYFRNIGRRFETKGQEECDSRK